MSAPDHPPPWRWKDDRLFDGNGVVIMEQVGTCPYVRDATALAPELEAALDDLSLATARYIIATDAAPARDGVPSPTEAGREMMASMTRARTLVDRLKAARKSGG